MGDLTKIFSFASDWKLTEDLQASFVKELTINGQQFVVQPNVYDVTHNYKTWTNFTDTTYCNFF
jgi:hypothetical protein